MFNKTHPSYYSDRFYAIVSNTCNLSCCELDLLQSILAVELPPVVIIPSVAADIDTIPGPVLAAVAPVEKANDEPK